MSRANQRRMMANTSQSVHCMRCRSSVCYAMSWRAEPSDSQITVSSRLKEH